MTADTERGGHRSEGCRRGAAIDGALADPDDQRAIVRTAYARTGRAGPHPDGNPHHPSVRATAVQIVYSSRRGSRDIEHIGSAHDEAELEVLKVAARPRLVAGQVELDLGLERTEAARRGAGGGPMPITRPPRSQRRSRSAP
jgi:hypothetical protein